MSGIAQAWLRLDVKEQLILRVRTTVFASVGQIPASCPYCDVDRKK
jgi:hypothetical protein